jgi:hypothetical protein
MASIGKSQSAATVEEVSIPSEPNRRLDRKTLALTLTAAGFPISHATLATLASRGGGPAFQRWGKKPLYSWGAALEWAEGRLGAPVRSTSEARAVPADALRDLLRGAA